MRNRTMFMQCAWVILTEECGANYDDFTMLQQFVCGEWDEFRFQGDLGFGGKMYAKRDSAYVSCYPEDSTPERRVMIERANTRLTRLFDALCGDLG